MRENSRRLASCSACRPINPAFTADLLMPLHLRRRMIRSAGKPWNIGFAYRGEILLRDSELDPDAVRPYGRYGVGKITEHPVGLLVVAFMIFLVLWTVPKAWMFLTGSIVLGALIGLVLWFRHRKTSPAPTFVDKP